MTLERRERQRVDIHPRTAEASLKSRTRRRCTAHATVWPVAKLPAQPVLLLAAVFLAVAAKPSAAVAAGMPSASPQRLGPQQNPESLTLTAHLTAKQRHSRNKPHLIFAMIDDWGFHEVGFRGNPLAQTPFIDKMIDDALLIERHYSYRFCSPARRSFLSGRLPPHVGQKNTPDAHIDLRMETIADKLATAGYFTGHSGKVSRQQ